VFAMRDHEAAARAMQAAQGQGLGGAGSGF
jgi:hypothetical protein